MVEVALIIVMPPLLLTRKAVEVAPAVTSETIWKRLKLERDEVAEMVTMDRGEEVPKPVRETPAA